LAFNLTGAIVGYYRDVNDACHGFLRLPGHAGPQ
jgi:hypothetical protein